MEKEFSRMDAIEVHSTLRRTSYTKADFYRLIKELTDENNTIKEIATTVNNGWTLNRVIERLKGFKVDERLIMALDDEEKAMLDEMIDERDSLLCGLIERSKDEEISWDLPNIMLPGIRRVKRYLGEAAVQYFDEAEKKGIIVDLRNGCYKMADGYTLEDLAHFCALVDYNIRSDGEGTPWGKYEPLFNVRNMKTKYARFSDRIDVKKKEKKYRKIRSVFGLSMWP